MKRRSGFTIVEMLIVIAIIAVLVAIAIPIFANQLENSREATDKANIRSAYAEVAAAALNAPAAEATATVQKQQTIEGWQSLTQGSTENIAGVAVSAINSNEETVVAYDPDTPTQITIDGQPATSTYLD